MIADADIAVDGCGTDHGRRTDVTSHGLYVNEKEEELGARSILREMCATFCSNSNEDRREYRCSCEQ